MKKRIIAFLLCILMAVTSVPLTPELDFLSLEASAASIKVEALDPFSNTSSGKLKMTKNTSEIFKVMVRPAEATDKTLNWSSSSSSVVSVSEAEVSASGIASVKLTAKQVGSARITYSTTDGSGLSGSFTVDVLPLVSSVTLDQKVKSITLKSSGEKLTAKVSPSDAGNPKLQWLSSDESVCKVDYNGVLFPVSTGECYISAATTDGSDIVATCRLVVGAKAKSIKLSKSSETLENGGGFTLYATVTTEDGSTHDAVNWTSSSTKVATVDKDGVVMAKYPGTTTIKATAADGSGKSASCLVTVTQKITKITLDEETTVGRGLTKALNVTITPSYATEKTLLWSSSDTSVATVSATGTVRGIKTGTTTITCKSADGSVSDTCKVTVVIAPTGISLSSINEELWKDNSLQLTATVTPADATDKSVTWSSSNVNVAKVSSTGIVTGVAGGSCIITAKNSQGHTAQCAIRVLEKVSGVEISENLKVMYVTQVDKISASVLPSTATNKGINWTSSNTSVATVDSNGSITALKTGTATITATTSDGGFKAYCVVTVNKKVAVTGVKLDRTSITLKARETFQFLATLSPANASDKRVVFATSNSAVAKISSTGVLTGVAPGSAVITATTVDGNFSAQCKVTVVQPVTGVSLSKESVKLAVGKTSSLSWSVMPSNASNKSVTWSSSNTSVATISSKGVITAKKAGTATITIKTVDGSMTASCNVTVYVPVTGVKVSVSSLKVPKGETRVVTAVISPSNASTKTVTWSTADKSIATISSSGRITGVKKGETTITCKTSDGSFKASCTVKVIQLADKVSIDATSVSLKAGQSKTLTAKVSPTSATYRTVKWKSSNTKVATVSSNGVVKAVSAGSATITAYSADGNAKASCSIKVTQPPKGIKFTDTTKYVRIGKTVTLKAAVLPSNASNKTVMWSSSNKKRATVSSKGVVKGNAKGSVTITARTADGKYSVSYKMLVVKGVKSISLDKTSVTMNVGKSTTVTPTISPKDATIKTVKWYSSDNDVATVDKNGKITAKSAGHVTITAKTVDGGVKARVSVLVIKPVKKVAIKVSSPYVNVKDKIRLKAVIAPSDASIKSVTWKSSNPKIAKVSSTGVVTALKKGTVTITCTTTNGKKVDTCKLQVVKKVTKVTLNRSNEILYLGDKLTLKHTVYPTDATIKSVTYHSSNESVAKVSSKGVVTPINLGTAKIYVITRDGSLKDVCKVTVKKAPEKIKLGATSVTLKAGESKTLKYVVYPTDATNRTATFTSSNTKVVKVSSTGKLTAVSRGTATITVKTENGIKAVCKVTVKQQVTSVEIEPTATVYTGKQIAPKAAALPSNAENKALKWTSSDTSVAKVSSKGVITGIRAGTATITVTSQENSKLKATCKVTVKQRVTSLKFDEREIFINKGATLDLKYTLSPSDATNKKVIFKSSDSSIISVTSDGRITAHKSGNAKITVTAQENSSISAICYVTAGEPVAGVSLDFKEKEIFVGSKLTLAATVSPSDAHNKLVRWSSDNAKVASVDSKGVVTALKSGTAIITATTVDGGFKASCKLILLQRATSISLEKSALTLNRGEGCQLRATVLPTDCYDKSYEWTSANESIATVTADGLVITRAPGVTILTCTSLESGVTAKLTLTVHEPVTDFALGEEEITLYTPLSAKLTTSFLPLNASDKSVTYESSDESVAKVSQDGTITATGKGTAIITATSVDSGITDSCEVTVLRGVEEIITEKDAYALHENTSMKLDYSFSPEEPDDARVTFTSSDEEIFTVSDDGTITGIKPGRASLTITSVQNPKVNKTVEIRITRAVTGITMDIREKTIFAGESFELVFEIAPADASDKTVSWTSSNTEVVTVDESGKVTAVSRGFATVTATTTDGGFTASCTIEVIQLPEKVEGSFDSKELFMGNTLELNMTVLPEDTNDKSLTYESSDEGVATVDENGIVTPVYPGTCYVTARSIRQGVEKTVKLTVIQLAEEIKFLCRIPELFAGERVRIIATVLPESTTDKRVEWISSDSSVVKIDQNGVITAVSAGIAQITAKSLDQGEASKSITVTVVDQIKGITLPEKTKTMELGSSVELKATVLPEMAYDKTVSYKSSDESVATVDNEGRVTAVKKGTATITATTADGKFSAKTLVTVIKSAEDIKLYRKDFDLISGDRVKVQFDILPEDASPVEVVWKSSKESVATVNDAGIITAVGKGSATITLTIAGTSISKDLSVIVG